MSFGLDINGLRQLKQVAQNPSQSEKVQAVATIQANLEHDLLDAVADLHDALGVEDPIEVTQDRADRREALLEVAEHASDDFESYWFGEVAGYDNPEDAVALAGLSDEEWESQIATWADRYRSQTDAFATDSDRGIAREHVRRTFGVPLEEFEREVVDYRRRDALKAVLAGNLTAGIQGVRQAADAARDQRGGET